MLDIMWNCCSGNVLMTSPVKVILPYQECQHRHKPSCRQWYRSNLGHFDTIVGYEVEASASNPNVDRSYGYDLEPFTHTGVLASTSING